MAFTTLSITSLVTHTLAAGIKPLKMLNRAIERVKPE
jgi:hypothetical protein